MLRRLALIGVVVLLLGGVGVALFTSTQPETPGADRGSARSSASRLGNVDGLALRAFEGDGRIDVAAVGKPLVINYWASWCLFCIDEMPDFQKVYADVSERVSFLGVNLQDDPTQARLLVKATGVRYTLASDPDGKGYDFFKGLGMPITVFVDEDGTIVEKVEGPLTAEALRARIRDHFDA